MRSSHCSLSAGGILITSLVFSVITPASHNFLTEIQIRKLAHMLS